MPHLQIQPPKEKGLQALRDPTPYLFSNREAFKDLLLPAYKELF